MFMFCGKSRPIKMVGFFRFTVIYRVDTILLGRVDLRVDHGHFRNHMNIKESPRADSPVRLSRIGTGRHGGRPSHEQQANPTLPI